MSKPGDKKRSIGLLFLIALGVVLLFHTQFSFSQSDEPFYLSTVKRLYQGDKLIIDEWHPTQFYSPILLPLYALFRLFVGSDESVILWFRVGTVLLSIVCSILLFIEVKKENRLFFSFCTAALLMLFSRANIAGPSYYNLNLYFSVLFFVAWKRALQRKGRNALFYSLLSGFFVSLAILCQPFTAIPFVAFFILILIRKQTRGKAAYAIAAMILMGILYVTVFLMKDSINAYLTNLRYILNDPQHQAGILATVKDIVNKHISSLSVACCLATMLLSVWFVMSRKHGKQLTRGQLLCQISLVGLSLIKPVINIGSIPCYSYFAGITIATFPSFLFCIGEKGKRTATGIYLLGICLALSWAFGSNTTFDAMLVGYSLSCIGGLLLVAELIRDTENIADWRKRLSGMLTIICSLVLVVALAQRITGVYRDGPINQMNTRIVQGPAKGLITTAGTAEQYNEIYNTIRAVYEKTDHARVIHLKKLPWAYLACDWKCCSPSTWTTEIGESRLEDYYELHGGMSPDFWFVYKPEAGKYATTLLNDHKGDNQPNKMDMKGKLSEKLLEGGYDITDYPYMTVYFNTEHNTPLQEWRNKILRWKPGDFGSTGKECVLLVRCLLQCVVFEGGC